MFGGVDPQYYTDSIHYVPVVRKAYWQFDLGSISLGDTVVSQRTTAIADTGTSLLIGPKDRVKALVDLLKLPAAPGGDGAAATMAAAATLMRAAASSSRSRVMRSTGCQR